MARVRVLIIDDSALVRQALTEVFQTDPAIEVVGTASDPYQAVERMRHVAPDVLVLDIEMPKMDGLTFLRKLMKQHPIPTVICSAHVGNRSEQALAALEAGAVELIAKPTSGTLQFLEESHLRICDTVKAAARAKLSAQRSGAARLPQQGGQVARPPRASISDVSSPVLPSEVAPLVSALRRDMEPVEPRKVPEKVSADAILRFSPNGAVRGNERVIVVGASTGGTDAVKVLLENFPADCPGVVVVLHMPEGFTAAYSRRLNGLLSLEVKEAERGDAVLPGRVLIARGDHHLLLKHGSTGYHVDVTPGQLVSRHRPSVDVLFRSAAMVAGANAVGIILTGMGDDGAQGMLELKQMGAVTYAQNEASCVVYGMPAEAVRKGAVDHVLPLTAIPAAVMSSLLTCGRGQSARTTQS